MASSFSFGAAVAPAVTADFPPAQVVVDWVDVTIPKETEICIHVPFGETGAKLSMMRPQSRQMQCDAEVCGTPLAHTHVYPLREGSSFAVWSWQGCTLRLRGSESFRATGAYRSAGTNYKGIVEYHTALHRARERAQQQEPPVVGETAPRNHGVGPRVVVCGARSSGRHSVARTLANYAVREPAGWAPTFVDLDPVHPTFGPPGCIGVGAWEYGSAIDEDVTHMAASLYWTGAQSVMSTAEAVPSAFGPVSSVLNLVSAAVLRAANHRLKGHAGGVVGWSGAIVVVPFIPDPVQHARFVASVANSIDATNVLCVGDDELAATLARRLAATLDDSVSPTPGVFTTAHGTTLQLDITSAAGGVVDWGLPALEAASRNARLRSYFTGVPKVLSLVPINHSIPFSDIDVIRWVEGPDGQPNPQRVAESLYVSVCDKRLGALFRAADSVQSQPVLFPCHVSSVDYSSMNVRLCGVLPKNEKLVLVVGSITWLE